MRRITEKMIRTLRLEPANQPKRTVGEFARTPHHLVVPHNFPLQATFYRIQQQKPTPFPTPWNMDQLHRPTEPRRGPLSHKTPQQTTSPSGAVCGRIAWTLAQAANHRSPLWTTSTRRHSSGIQVPLRASLPTRLIFLTVCNLWPNHGI